MTLAVRARGEGLPILVLPSFSLDGNAMAMAFEPALAGSPGWQRLYVDLPGTGSSPPGEPRSDAVLDELAATVLSVLGGERFLVAGYDQADYLVLADAGHYLPLEQPGWFGAAAAAWLGACGRWPGAGSAAG